MEFFKVEVCVILLVCLSFDCRPSGSCAPIGQLDGRVSLLHCCGHSLASASDVIAADKVNPGLVSVPQALLVCRSSRYVFVSRERRSLPAVVTALLLLLGGVESNPGPVSSITLGVFNVRSVVRKAALLHSLIADEKLDVVALSETWTSASDPPAIL